MQRSYNAGGAVAITGLLAFLIAQCGAADPGTAADTMAPPSTIVATTIDSPVTTLPVRGTAPTTFAVATSSTTTTVPAPSTTRPAQLTTTTSTAAPTTTIAAPPPPATAPTPPRPTTPASTALLAQPTPPPTAAPTTAAPTTAAPTTAAPPPPPAPAPTPGATPSPDAVSLTNQQRQSAGLSALSTDGALTAAAAQHSADQAARNSMGHTGSNGSSAADRIRANGGSFSTWGENVAAGYGSASGVVGGWMNSPGHRDNILSSAFTRIGVAVAISADGTPYWTMVLSG
jgi:uncharacterized protein YkwD